MTSLTLTPGDATLEELKALYEQGLALKLDWNCKEKVEKAANVVANAAAGDEPVYGVNTGFGKLAQVRIAPDETATLQRNLILSHACGVGDDLPQSVVRLVMVLKLLSLGRGASGVRWDVINVIEQMLERGVTPSIPGQGSVGASGDLAPLAHLAAVMMGEGEAYYKGERLSGAQAMRKAGVEPVVFIAKEGLALINGTQVSTALAIANLFETHRLFCSALVTGALSTDAAMGSSAPFHPQIHELRGHQGQVDSATALRELMRGSEIRESHRDDDERVQDPYCIRCQPQVMGACLDLMRSVAKTLEIEANAVTDNPLIFLDDGSIVSGGNFHAEPVAFAADQLALAIAEIGSITERRIAMLVDPALNFGLPAFLTSEPGVNSGFMVAEITAAALYSENKQRAAPCSVDSTPTSANQEDHVSMAAHAARRLFDMNANLANIIAIEWLIASQGIELRTPLKTSGVLNGAIDLLRSSVPILQQDRYLSPDIKSSCELVSSGRLCEAVSAIHLPSLK